MIVDGLTLDGCRAEVTVRVETAATHRLSWTLPSDCTADAAGAGDAALVAALLPAMARAEPLAIAHPASRHLLSNLPAVQDVFVSWSLQSELMDGIAPVFRHVPVDAAERGSSAGASAQGIASFFSGGVDSFYTVIKHRHELSALVFVHGFDVALEDHVQRKQVTAGLRRAACDIGLPLLEVETNIRGFSDRYVDWLDAHGAALGSVALLLGQLFRRVYVPATDTYATLAPMGSHPLIDPLWSTERVEIVHDGCEADRLDKLRAIDGCPAARAWLRVCVRKGANAYNCGHCWKCVRTMVGLRVLGIADRFETLPDLPERSLLRRVAFSNVLDSARTPRTWQRHRTIWSPYLHAEQSSPEHRRLGGALMMRFLLGRLKTVKHTRRSLRIGRPRRPCTGRR